MLKSHNRYLLVVVGALIAMRLATEPTANMSYFLLAAYALLGRPHAIQALALSWLFSMLSPGIASEASIASIGRYAVVLGAALSVFMRRKVVSGTLCVRPPVAAILGLGLFFVLHALLVSPMPDVSILKAVSWVLVMATLVSAWHGLTIEERERLANQLFYGLVLILVVSLPLLMLPLGYLRNGSGFQGILNHPQAFGPTMALLGAWAGSQLFARRRPPWSTILLFGASLVLVLLSEARTAGLAMLLGIFGAVCSAPLLSGGPLKVIMPGLRSKRVWSVLGAALLLSIIFAPSIADVVSNYISKSGRAGDVQSIEEAYEGSRGGLILKMWGNIVEHPYTGIGFGIGSNVDEMLVGRDPVFNLPVSASIEKGVLPLAVLEELGLIGVAIVARWFWAIVRRAAKGGVSPLAVTVTVLLLNMGEYTLFSPGGLGLLTLVLIGWAGSAPQSGIKVT